MQHRDSRSAISGTAALKLDARVSSAHIIQFPGSEYSARQIDDISSCHPADESRRSNARIRQSGDSRQPCQAEPRATPAQTAGAITLFALLTIIAGIF